MKPKIVLIKAVRRFQDSLSSPQHFCSFFWRNTGFLGSIILFSQYRLGRDREETLAYSAISIQESRDFGL